MSRGLAVRSTWVETAAVLRKAVKTGTAGKKSIVEGGSCHSQSGDYAGGRRGGDCQESEITPRQGQCSAGLSNISFQSMHGGSCFQSMHGGSSFVNSPQVPTLHLGVSLVPAVRSIACEDGLHWNAHKRDSPLPPRPHPQLQGRQVSLETASLRAMQMMTEDQTGLDRQSPQKVRSFVILADAGFQRRLARDNKLFLELLIIC